MCRFFTTELRGVAQNSTAGIINDKTVSCAEFKPIPIPFNPLPTPCDSVKPSATLWFMDLFSLIVKLPYPLQHYVK